MHGTGGDKDRIPGLDFPAFNDIEHGFLSDRRADIFPGHTGTEAADKLCTRVSLHHIPGLCLAKEARACQPFRLFIVRVDLKG